MFSLYKELGDRFIEFVLRMVKGETLEDQLTSALKSAIFLVSVLGFVITALAVSNANLRLQLSDMEVGLSKVNLLFDSQDGGPIQGFFKLNDILSAQNTVVKQENFQLVKTNVTLTGEVNWLRFQLVDVLEQNKLLKQNNDFLLLKCMPEGVPDLGNVPLLKDKKSQKK